MSSARKTASSSFFHECARAGLHVKHERVSAFRQFLAHDRCANEIWTLDGSGDVAQRIQFSVSRRDFFSLTNHAAATSLQNAMKLWYRQTYAKSGNGFEFIERASRMAKSAATDHGDKETAGRYKRS